MLMACGNHMELKDDGGKISNKCVSGSLSSSNGSTKRTRNGNVIYGGSATVKFKTTSNDGPERLSKHSRGANVKLSSRKLCQGKGKNSVGTVDQAIRERNIFTAVAKMPAEVQTTLMENGWIGKITVNDIFRPRGLTPTVEVISLHNRLERVKAVVKRYESGLVWTDAQSGGVNWMTLEPDVMVNRFPRDANASLKLCGHTLPGKSEFDYHYPRAYPISTNVDRFIADYSLTACVSLLRAFVDGDHYSMCAKNGQVPLSVLNFAAIKCHQYLTDGRSLRVTSFPGKGAGWETFFQHYYKIVHDRQKFTVPAAGDDADVALRDLATSAGLLVDQLTVARPQTAMDGYENVWIVKSIVGHRDRPVMLKKLDDVLERCSRVVSSDRIVQKYIETPLLRDNVKSDVHTWIVISTLGSRLTVWLHRKCAVQPYQHGFSLHRDAAKTGHFDRLKSGGLHGMLRPTALTCGLKQLGTKMRRVVKTDKQQQKRRQQQQRVNDDDVCSAVRRSVVSAVTAAVMAGSLNLRPNCLELFRGTFVLGDDLQPWLIDIVSDDPFMAADSRERDRSAPSATMARTVVRAVAHMLVDGGRGQETKIGMFDMVHEMSMTSGIVSYTPRPFNMATSTPTPVASKFLAARTNRSQGHSSYTRASRSNFEGTCYHHHWWDDDSISTYVQTISAEDVQEQVHTHFPAIGPQTALAAAAASHHVDMLVGSAENPQLYGPQDTHKCLRLLDKCKTKIASVQRICKSIIRHDHNKNKRKAR